MDGSYFLAEIGITLLAGGDKRQLLGDAYKQAVALAGEATQRSNGPGLGAVFLQPRKLQIGDGGALFQKILDFPLVFFS